MSRALYILVIAALLALLGVLITSQIDQTQLKSRYLRRNMGAVMPIYRVDEMDDDVIELSHIVDAPTPIVAASKATNLPVTERRGRLQWVRVIDAKRGLSFEFE